LELFPASQSTEADRLYLQELTTFSLSRVEKEPRLLSEKQNELKQQIEELAVGNYRCFVESSQRVHDAYRSVTDMDSKLNDLSTHLPSFIQKGQDFTESAKRLHEAQKLNRLMLKVLF